MRKYPQYLYIGNHTRLAGLSSRPFNFLLVSLVVSPHKQEKLHDRESELHPIKSITRRHTHTQMEADVPMPFSFLPYHNHPFLPTNPSCILKILR